MANLLVTISSLYGIITITDTEHDPNQSTATYQINDNCIAVVFFGHKHVKNFIENYVEAIKSSDFEKLIKEVSKAFDLHYKDYEKSGGFSALFMTYANNSPIYHAFWFDQEGHHNMRLPKAKPSYFIRDVEDLSNYLTSKVYSYHMSLEEITNLAVFIALQCMKIFGYDFNFDVTSVSEDGIKKLTNQEIKSLFYNQEIIDHKLKMSFSDFFIRGSEVK